MYGLLPTFAQVNLNVPGGSLSQRSDSKLSHSLPQNDCVTTQSAPQSAYDSSK